MNKCMFTSEKMDESINKLPNHIFTIRQTRTPCIRQHGWEWQRLHPLATRQINVGRVDRTMKSPAATATRKKKDSIKGATEISFMVLEHFSIGQCWCSGASVLPPLTADHVPLMISMYHIQVQFYEHQTRPNSYRTDIWFAISFVMKIT